jgi:four helix bundle protein
VEEKIRGFKDLKVWQRSMELADRIFRETRVFPDEERYGLSAQMKRAAVSIPSNVAEGFNRYHKKEYTQFLYHELGSCAELETQVIIAAQQGFLREENKNAMVETLDHIQAMLRNLIKKLK